MITTIPGRDFRLAKAPTASKFAPGEFVIFSADELESPCPAAMIRIVPHEAFSAGVLQALGNPVDGGEERAEEILIFIVGVTPAP